MCKHLPFHCLCRSQSQFTSASLPLYCTVRLHHFLHNLPLQPDVWFNTWRKSICVQTWQVNESPLKANYFPCAFRACVGARDPYCGWDLLLKKCTTLEESVRMSQWEQSITKCPVSIVVVLHLIWFFLYDSDYLHQASTVTCEFNTHINMCSNCSVFSPQTHNFHYNQQRFKPSWEMYVSLPEKRHLGSKQRDS